MDRRSTLIGGVMGFYLLALGFLGGVVCERVRFDHQRNAVLSRYDEARSRLHAYLMTLEREGLPEHNVVNQ